MEANHESNLTNLQAPLLAEYLVTFHWEPRLFSVEYEVIGENGIDLSREDQLLYEWISSMFTMLENVVNVKADNHLFLSIQLEEKEVRFFFEISGIIEDTDRLSAWIQTQPNYFVIESSSVSPEECVIQQVFTKGNNNKADGAS
ncbi:Spo0B C-terminal domain-containing protein [Sutcliffiella halmapala]|uniref:Spo0B C-terminal domain-containing protein n=1 Tax=Sutcliffiella halmapala TaxID=79882 RepID=UPI0038B429C7